MNDRRPGSSQQPRAAMPAVAVGVAIVGAILCFLILKQFGGDGDTKKTDPVADGSDGSAVESEPTTTVLGPDGLPVTVAPPPGVVVTTPPPAAVTRDSFTVVVANASKVGGAAAAMKTALERELYRTLPATNVLDSIIPPPISVTRIMFAPGFEAAAADVSKMLGGIVPEPITVTPVGPDSAGANIIIALGTDLAKKPLPGGSAQVQVGTDPAAVPQSVPTADSSPNAAPPATG
jgi:LytR cell envelope-related transcriptional attenuator